jgi:hypothetical protein
MSTRTSNANAPLNALGSGGKIGNWTLPWLVAHIYPELTRWR